MTERETRTQWFTEARFGMFIHWGLYAIPGRGEWYMSEAKIPAEQYERYMQEFSAKAYDPRDWARRAKRAGMQYVVLTAKHHDGFCLFDSRLTDYKSTNAPCERDLVREFVDAVRAEGLRVGLYYSLIDWHHPDFPKYNDCNHPMRGDPAYQDEKIDFDRYLAYMHGQIEELVTNYGKIDILWFDYAYDELRGEAWRATELIRMVRRHQPDVIIDNRLETSGEGFGSLVTEQPAYYSGDFVSPEQILPPEGIRNVRGERVPWELCTTMNNNWGYNPYDTDYKPASMLIRKLVECVSKGGNMILNVGPDANGRFNDASCRLLDEIGTWLAVNGESIYGCGSADVPKPDWGWYTKKDDRIYAHILENPIGPLALTGLDAKRVGAVRRTAARCCAERVGSQMLTKTLHLSHLVRSRTLPICFQIRLTPCWRSNIRRLAYESNYRDRFGRGSARRERLCRLRAELPERAENRRRGGAARRSPRRICQGARHSRRPLLCRLGGRAQTGQIRRLCIRLHTRPDALRAGHAGAGKGL